MVPSPEGGVDSDEVMEEAVEIVESETDEPMPLRDFVDLVVDDSSLACSAPEYLLRAIEHFGTREVEEFGETKQRWRFFDDPANHGEHAILGNTDLLNQFVDDLREMARGPSNEEKMFWFEGPTATGKSEIRRCLTNGLHAFSKTDEGKRFTIEWNVTGADADDRGMTYGDGGSANSERHWYKSPVQSNPLSVLPEESRRRVLYGDVDEYTKWIPPGLDPFSEVAYDELERRYDGDFDQITGENHLRVVRYHVDIGRGIGVLQSEDDGRPRQKLVGQWMSGMVRELDSRGRRDPRALSYDGVLSQGNGGITIVEDAIHHFDTIVNMLSVPEADEVKIDRREILPVDTVPIIISNPDFRDEVLYAETPAGQDAYKPLRRRLNHYPVEYLVTPSIEAELLNRMLTGYEPVWESGSERMQQAVHIDDVEIAPHALEAAAFYNVVTRFDGNGHLDQIEIARVNDGQEIEAFDEDEDDIDELVTDVGRDGLPCTFTRDTLMDTVRDADDGLVMPREVIDAIVDSMEGSAVIMAEEAGTYQTYDIDVREYILEQQEEDVLAAILRDHSVSEEQVQEYVEEVYKWGDDQVSEEPDELTLRVFEQEHLGLFDDSHYDSVKDVSNQVQEHRGKVIDAVSNYLFEHGGDDFEVDVSDVSFEDVPAIEEALDEYEWIDVDRHFEHLDPYAWNNPAEGTQTEAVKQRTIEHMIDMFGYSEKSAKRTSEVVFDIVSDEYNWSTNEGGD